MAERKPPDWEGPIEAWTIKYAKKNLWRVVPHYDVEDLRQEGYIIYLDCCVRYGESKDPKYFFALYRKCFFNFIHDASKTRSGENEFKACNTERRKELEEFGSLDLVELDDTFLVSGPDSLKKLCVAIVSNSDEIDLGYQQDLAMDWRETSLQRLVRLFGSHRGWQEARMWLEGQGYLPIT